MYLGLVRLNWLAEGHFSTRTMAPRAQFTVAVATAMLTQMSVLNATEYPENAVHGTTGAVKASFAFKMKNHHLLKDLAESTAISWCTDISSVAKEVFERVQLMKGA